MSTKELLKIMENNEMYWNYIYEIESTPRADVEKASRC